MAIATWDPTQPTSNDLTLAQLQAVAEQYHLNCDVQAIFSPPSFRQAVMKRKDWRLANDLSDQALWQLVILFTRLEAEDASFTAGESNPAIAFFKILKKRKATPDSEQVRWLKSLTNNRYIPHGPVTF